MTNKFFENESGFPSTENKAIKTVTSFIIIFFRALFCSNVGLFIDLKDSMNLIKESDTFCKPLKVYD